MKDKQEIEVRYEDEDGKPLIVGDCLDHVLLCGGSRVVFVQTGRDKFTLFAYAGKNLVGLNRFTDECYSRHDEMPYYLGVIVDEKVRRF